MINHYASENEKIWALGVIFAVVMCLIIKE